MGTAQERTERIPASGVLLEGDLGIPEGTAGVVLFAHGSGSSRLSPRNRAVALSLRQAGLGTLLTDLLTPGEEAEDEETAGLRFDIPLLAGRLEGILDWMGTAPATRGLKAGLFGASTGGGAALVAAAGRPQAVAAVVSRGGRPDLAGEEVLARVRAPVLLIVGEEDYPVIQMNRWALERLQDPKRLAIVPGATHLFEEPGALEEVARLTAAWFLEHLR